MGAKAIKLGSWDKHLHTARIEMSMSGICSMKGNVMQYFKPGEQNENDVLFSYDTGKLGKRNSECSYQESNLRPSDL